MVDQLCDLKVTINGKHTFFLNQKILCSFSLTLKKMIEKAKKRRSPEIKIMDFPGGSNGFELISRFCYNNGRIPISPSNITLLHCSATALEITQLLNQSETFLDGLFYWTWSDILTSLKNCEPPPLFAVADSSGLLLKLISSLVSKISDHSDFPLTEATPFPSSSPSFSSSSPSPESVHHSFVKEWWFDDLTILPPPIIEKLLKTLRAYTTDNKNLVITRFLLHYLKRAGNCNGRYKLDRYSGIAETVVYGVVLMGRAAFSCRGLFWVLRVVSGFGLSRECRGMLERVIGLMLDTSTLDDLLVCGNGEHVYDVSLVLRLIRVFVRGYEESGVPLTRLKKVGRLVDKYLEEIAPDQGLKVDKFLGVAESLPESARDCFDEVYRAVDIYLQSHPTLSAEESSRLCRCLNYEKLTLESCRDFAKNPRIPPGAAIQALISQQNKQPSKTSFSSVASQESCKTPARQPMLRVEAEDTGTTASSTGTVESSWNEKEELRLNLQKMQNRVKELEDVCMEMKSQMSKMVKGKGILSRTRAPKTNRGRTKLC